MIPHNFFTPSWKNCTENGQCNQKKVTSWTSPRPLNHYILGDRWGFLHFQMFGFFVVLGLARFLQGRKPCKARRDEAGNLVDRVWLVGVTYPTMETHKGWLVHPFFTCRTCAKIKRRKKKEVIESFWNHCDIRVRVEFFQEWVTACFSKLSSVSWWREFRVLRMKISSTYPIPVNPHFGMLESEKKH